ncbi:MAG TPA: serine hydrolase [Sphingomonas sp.]|nr:serine hydrolase [Sphingomonas sp.]
MTLTTLPTQPPGTEWPTHHWPEAPLAGTTDIDRLSSLMDVAFSDEAQTGLSKTHSVVLVQRGEIVFERYASGHDAATLQPSWSMAKSITHALVGLLVGDGLLAIDSPAQVPEWQQEGDPRRDITLDHLLRMSSGLRFLEEYVEGQPSDVIEMLFGAGKADVAGFAASFPLDHAPGSHWSYASGTTNIIARAAAHALGSDFRDYMIARLFEPLGMRSAAPRFDDSGTFIGSSFCFATPRDFARFGLLYLRDGVWEGNRLLPHGWVDHARTPTPQQDAVGANRYGAHWWLDYAAPGSFSANGYAGQFIILVPDRDLILVRNGDTPEAGKDILQGWLAQVVGCFRAI